MWAKLWKSAAVPLLGGETVVALVVIIVHHDYTAHGGRLLQIDLPRP